jgi:hypothetical protein
LGGPFPTTLAQSPWRHKEPDRDIYSVDASKYGRYYRGHKEEKISTAQEGVRIQQLITI